MKDVTVAMRTEYGESQAHLKQRRDCSVGSSLSPTSKNKVGTEHTHHSQLRISDWNNLLFFMSAAHSISTVRIDSDTACR